MPVALSTSWQVNSAPNTTSAILLSDTAKTWALAEDTRKKYEAADGLLAMKKKGNNPVRSPQIQSKKKVRFSQNIEADDADACETAEDMLLQIRILLKILESEDPMLRDRFVHVLKHCMLAYRGSERSNLVHIIMQNIVPQRYLRLATDARKRINTIHEVARDA